jgi:hypothetical protein
VKADVPIRRVFGSATKKSYHSSQRVPAGYNSETILEFDHGRIHIGPRSVTGNSSQG